MLEFIFGMNRWKKGVGILLFSLLVCNQAWATHITGAELVYECINPATNQYEVKVTVYRDCINGLAGFDNNIRLFIFRGSNGSLYNTANIPFSAVTTEIIPIEWNACTGAPYNICVEYSEYVTTLTLPPLAGGYDIGWARCCRNDIVTNVFDNQGITVIGHVPSADVTGCNSMPTFNQIPPVFLCVGQPFSFDHSATDADGDSLVYAISNPYTGVNTLGQGATQFNPVVNVGGPFGNPMGPPPYQNILFQGGFSFNDPFASGNFNMDPQSGLLTLVPIATGLSVFAVSVFEYRNGVLMSENKRDFQISVITCSPQGDEPIIDSSPVPGSSTDTIYVEPTESFCYNITVTDPSPTDSVILFPVSAAFGVGGTAPPPYATLNFTPGNPAVGQVCWAAPCENEGDTVLLIVGGQDPNDCPGYNIVFDTVLVIVNTRPRPTLTTTLPGGANDTVYIDPRENFCYDFTATDPDTDDTLEIIPISGPFAALGTPPPVASINYSGTNPIQGQVCWTPNCSGANKTATFIIAARDVNFCQRRDYDTLTVIVNPLPMTGINADTTLCATGSYELQATGGTAYSWSPPQGLNNTSISNPTATPQFSTTYTVVITDSVGCFQQQTVDVAVNQLPIPDAGPDVVKCPGIPVQLQATGGTSYSWTPPITLNNPSIANPIADPLTTTTYTVTVTDNNGCSDTDEIVVETMYGTVGPDQAICVGDSISLIAGGGVGYLWDNATSLSNANVPNPVAFPTTTTTYSVIVTGATGCIDTQQVTITVNPLPNANAGTDTEVCIGSGVQLQASGGVSYNWAPNYFLSNSNVSNPIASPTVDTTYYVVVTDANGCVNLDSIDVTVNPLPIVDAGIDTVKCGDISVQLDAIGGVGYTWTPALGLDNPNVSDPFANPDSSTTYLVTVTDVNGCVNTDSVFVRAFYALAGPDVAVCIGDSIQLNAGGGVAYQWDVSADLSVLNVADPFAFPTDTTDFYVTVTDTSGCVDRDTVNVVVNLPPVTSTFGSDPYVCSGGGTVVTATGGVIYDWMPNAIFDDPSLASPTASPTYSGSGGLDSTWTFYVMVTDTNGCRALDSLDQLVRLLPIVTASNDTTKCPGDTISLSSAGGVTFQWSPPYNISALDIPNPLVSPDTTTTYVVTVTAVWGCSDSVGVVVNVIDPQAGADTTICEGDSVQLQASGGVGYLWDNAATLSNPNIPNPVAFPTVTTSYLVTVTDTAGCTDVDTVTIFVNPYPPANAGPDTALCIGDTIQLEASGGIGYQWLVSDSLNNDTLFNPLAYPIQTTTYLVQVTDTNGCAQVDSMVLTVNPLPIADAGMDQTKCGVDSIQLLATGGIQYVWSPDLSLSNGTIADPMAASDSSTMFTVIVTDINGCVNTDSTFVQTMYATAEVQPASNVICFGDEIGLSAGTIGGLGVAYAWEPTAFLDDSTLIAPTAGPPVSTTYLVTVTDSSGCTDTATVLVEILPEPPADAGLDTAICIGDQIRLQAGGGVGYQWFPEIGLSNPNVANPLADPRETTEYTVLVTDVNGCTAFDTMLLTVNPLPVVVATEDLTICRNDIAFLEVTGADTYTWTPENDLTDPLGDMPLANPLLTTTYTVVGVDTNGCVNNDQVTVTVTQPPSVVGESAYDICVGQAVQLPISGDAFEYRWSTGEAGEEIRVAPAQTTRFWVVPVGPQGCVGDTLFIDVAVERNLPRAEFDPSEDDDFYPFTVDFANLSRNATNYVWRFGDGDSSDVADPRHVFEEPGTYSVTLIADNDIGCPDVFTYDFIQARDFNIFFPNAFSPNGDGNNDEFYGVMNSIEFFDIQIFNRWGEVIFVSNNPDFRWDGMGSKGTPAVEGAYVFKAVAVTFKGERIVRSGSITLIR